MLLLQPLTYENVSHASVYERINVVWNCSLTFRMPIPSTDYTKWTVFFFFFFGWKETHSPILEICFNFERCICFNSPRIESKSKRIQFINDKKKTILTQRGHVNETIAEYWIHQHTNVNVSWNERSTLWMYLLVSSCITDGMNNNLHSV